MSEPKQKKSKESSAVTTRTVAERTADIISFVRAWNASDSIAALSTTLGESPKTLASRAALCRKRGLTLKRFGRGTSIDWAGALEALDG